MKNFGFIILRHVSKPGQNVLWINCYKQIRKFYDDPIIIIDDNSCKNSIIRYIPLINCEVIQSEFPGRGEILPYYYMFKNKLFKKAVVLHDSTYIIRKIDFNSCNKPVQPLWTCCHKWNNEYKEIKFIKTIMKDSEKLIKFYYNKTRWRLCFGAMSIVTFNFLEEMQIKYKMFEL